MASTHLVTICRFQSLARGRIRKRRGALVADAIPGGAHLLLGPGGHRPGPCDPDIQQHFPDPAYFRFYIGHGGVLVAAVFLVVGRRIWPQPAAPVRVFLATIVFTAIAGLADILTAGNYMFLREKPRAGSLLNFLGPWPWYIASGLPLAILFLIVLNAPFWFRAVRRSAR